MKEDFCTSFPEYWYKWDTLHFVKYLPRFKKVYIGDCCKIHDSECNTINFVKCLWKKRIVGTVGITGVAMVACLLRYFKL